MAVGAFSAPFAVRGHVPWAQTSCKPGRRRVAATALESLPSDYDALRQEAVSAARSALKAGVPLIELQFPPVANMATAALNQLLDENRAFTREFLRSFSMLYNRERLNVVFPDFGEARLAQKTWGDVPFTLRSIPDKKEQGTPSYVRNAAETGASADDIGLIVVVNPGFNVSEWINMETLEGSDPIILINGDLDKGYYPRLFYPGLHAVKDRFLSRFEPVYYIKQFSNGGTLRRRFGEDWMLFYRNAANKETSLLKSYSERPPFRLVEDDLRTARTSDLQAKR